ncbi:MAG: polar amino acid transport system substrate-binding protein [Verrucomicrobiales bacterium]|jgi:polar amino acid transport system substrate-binding protein
MMHRTKFLAIVFSIGLVAVACGSDSVDSSELGLVSGDTLTVCTDVPYPPMEYEDADSPSGFTGFDIELTRAIATDLGLELAVVTPGWDAITSGLAMETDQCDLSASSITITPEREEGVDFTTSYFSAEQSLFVSASNGAEGAGDIGKIAVQSGTTGEIYAQDNLSNELISFDDAGALYLALEAGEVDGVITDLVGNQGYADENPGIGQVIATYATDEEYGMALQEEGAEALLAAVNASLAKFREDGTYDDLFAEWFSA